MQTIFDKYYKRYDAWYDKNKFVFLSEVEAIKKVLPKKGKGIEIGVGTGRFACELGIKTGIDPSKNMVKIAKSRGIDAKLGIGEKLPFKDETFDYAAIVITICFVKEALKLLKETKRILKKRGKIIVCIIDKNSFLGKFYQRKNSIFYKHANLFSIWELIDILKITGFNKFVYYQTIFDIPDKIKKIEKPRKGYGKGGFVVISSYK